MKGLKSTDALHSHQTEGSDALSIKDQSVSITSALTLKSTRALCVGEAGRGLGTRWEDGIPGVSPLIITEIKYFSLLNNNNNNEKKRLAFLSTVFLSPELSMNLLFRCGNKYSKEKLVYFEVYI